MPTPLNRIEQRALQASLNDAVSAIDEGRWAWANGTFSAAHMSLVTTGHTGLIKLQAEHRDKRLVLCEDTLQAMTDYEDIAAGLLAAFDSLHTDRKQESVKTPSGAWAVSRRILLRDRAYQHALVCTNPAVGIRELDQWESELRQSKLLEDAA